MKVRFTLISLLSLTTSLFAENDPSSLKVYDSIIYPVLEAKCISCHGAEKDKGKLRMHTKEALVKGGRGAGDAIIVKGEVEESELIYRITLPKDDEESMPPMEDESHYNPVTDKELSVLKSWIKLGASFDLLINDLDQAGKKAAEYVIKNLPEKKLSATALLIPKLPEVPVANPKILKDLQDSGILVMPIAQNTNALYVNASYKGKEFNDESVKMLEALAPQIVWLNIARTGVTDASSETLSKFTLLERLHAEKTDFTDVATQNISKLSNLKYLNLYGTSISDASIADFRKLRKLEKIFLWQTKVSPSGAESLRKNFVDQKAYDDLIKIKTLLISKTEKIAKSFDSEIEVMEKIKSNLSKNTDDKLPINDRCPISNKPIDDSKFSNFEGRMVGLCCNNCKTKFEKDPSSYRSKIANFVPSKAFGEQNEALKEMVDKKDKALEEVGAELRTLTTKINSMSPEINLGWTVAQSK